MSKRTKSFSDDWLSSVSQQLILTSLKTKEIEPLLMQMSSSSVSTVDVLMLC